MMFSQTRIPQVSSQTQENYLQSQQYLSQVRIQRIAQQSRMAMFQPVKSCSSCGK
jgi:hypothetical protein